MPDVCVVGEINPDLILYGLPQELKPEHEILANSFRFTLGSSSAILAHNLAALGTSVGIVAKIGKDIFGDQCLEWLEEAGVETSRVVAASSSESTGLTIVLAQPGHRFILTYPGTMSEFCFEDIDLDYVLSARHLHVSSFFLHRALRPRLGELFQQAKEQGLTTSLDPNDDPSNTWSDDLFDVLKHVDIFFPNEREARQIARTYELGIAVRELAKRVRLLVLKLGPEGALAREGDKEFRVGATPVNAIDAVGAGDSFDAGFVHQFLKGASTEECLQYAAMVGAYSTIAEGGVEAFRNRDKLTDFIRMNGQR